MWALKGLRVGLVLLAMGGATASGQETEHSITTCGRAAATEPRRWPVRELVLIAPGTQVDAHTCRQAGATLVIEVDSAAGVGRPQHLAGDG